MKRVGLIGVTVAILAFGSTTGVFAQQDSDQKDKQGRHENRGKDEKRVSAEQAKKEQEQQAIRDQQALQDRQQQDLRNQQEQRHGSGNQQWQHRDHQAFQTQGERNAQLVIQQRIDQQQQRSAAYQNVVAQQQRAAQTENAQLDRSRGSQRAVQQQYAMRLQQQSVQMQQGGYYNSNNRDPYYNSPWTYHYTVGREYRETNQYGMNVLTQAVNYGYQEGYRSGDADHRDHWRSDYRATFAYRDANYGYTGRYVNQSDYNYYFREGFRRGYQDGYSTHVKYGHQSNGSYSIMQAYVPGILKFEVIR